MKKKRIYNMVPNNQAKLFYFRRQNVWAKQLIRNGSSNIFHLLQLKENLVRNTTCSEQMVYSAIETTCFGLYWPSSGFYNSLGAVYICCKNYAGILDFKLSP